MALLLGATGSPAATLADCNAAAPWQVLQAEAPGLPAHARAVWLDSRHLRWPGVGGSGRVVLHRSLAGTLQATPGQPVTGADLVLPTQAEADGRFSVAAPALPRGQWLVVHEDEQGRVLQATRPQVAAALDALLGDAAEAAPEPGAHPGPAGTRFSVWAPTAHAVHLCLYPGPEAAATELYALAHDAASGFWQRVLPAHLQGSYATYLVDVHAPGTGRVQNRVTDPYAVSLNADSQRSYIANLAHPALAPAGWAGQRRPDTVRHNTDLVVYELHVRDFSRDDPGVPAALRGRYAAFAHPGSAGLRHLRRLARAGLTDVHLLPVFDLASIPERGCTTPTLHGAPDGRSQQAALAGAKAADCFNWGYDPLHYSAPEGSYSSDAQDGAVRIREFRQMVLALHRAGLRVGLDVVYNHTSASGQHPHSVLDRIVPGYYHRLDADGAVATSTCCANTATEHRLMARLMIDSVRRWVHHYGIDSFRFDLMGHQPRAVMERLQQAVNAEAGRHVPLIGEGWNFGEVADGARFVQASQGSLQGSGIATFSDRARDALRGGGPGDHGADLLQRRGWLTGGATDAPDPNTTDLVRLGLAGTLTALQRPDGPRYNGQPAAYVAQPGEVVNYVENHDNHTLFDILALKLPPATPSHERARVQLLGLAAVAFSQGVAYFHAGGELMRSKSLDRNSYDSGDHFNRLDWSGRDNGFGQGLPPAWDNERDWPQLQPLLADAARIQPRAEDIAFVRRGFEALLRVRASTRLLRLRSAAEIQQRLRFHDTGAGWVLAELRGHGLPGARWGRLLLALNPQPQAQQLALPGLRATLHPALAGQPHLRAVRTLAGTVRVPPRSAVVWVGPHL